MLAPKAQYSLSDAKKYFKEHLSVGDYYAEGQHVPGHWFGQCATDLGLHGITTMDQFERLCDNLHPQTGERLTLRQKTTRTEMDADGKEREAANRRIFYDFTFSPPKSVSIAALVCSDSRILDHLSSNPVIGLPESDRLPLWEALVDLISKHRHFEDAEWSIDVADVAKLEETAKKLSPTSPNLFHRRLFSNRDFNLYEEKHGVADYAEQEKNLACVVKLL